MPTQPSADHVERVARKLLKALKNANPDKPYAATIYSLKDSTCRGTAINEELRKGPLAHAEMGTLLSSKTLLPGSRVSVDDKFLFFVSTRPCPMCTAAIVEAGFFTVWMFYDNEYDVGVAERIIDAKYEHRANRRPYPRHPFSFQQLDSEWKAIFCAIAEKKLNPKDFDKAIRDALNREGAFDDRFLKPEHRPSVPSAGVSAKKRTQGYLRSLRGGKGKNHDLRPLLKKWPAFSGIILHDEAAPLRKVRNELEADGAIEIFETDSTKRFKGWVVDSHRHGGWKRVLLVETGMGSMNASLATYELAAGLVGKPPSACRILKVGTCSGLYSNEPVGTVLVPAYAINDEGASKWNERIPHESNQWIPAVLDTLFKMKPIRPEGSLTKKWRTYLGSKLGQRLWSSFPAIDRYPNEEKPEPAVWSVDNFHGVRSLIRHVYPAIQKYIDEAEPPPRIVPVAVENECSSHFSACNGLSGATGWKLEIAAALVISWSRDHVLKQKDTRTPAEKEEAHDTEARLIIKAVHFLLREDPSE